MLNVEGFVICNLYLWSELFETCSSLFENFQPVTGYSTLVPNGRYVIDPDGPMGVDPFEVVCDFPFKTTLHVTSKQALQTSITHF